MAVKAVATPIYVAPSSTGTFQVDLRVAATDSSTAFSLSVPNIPGNILQGLLDSAIKQAVKDELINNYGFTFGLLDTIVLLGSTI